jgi:hypothetical protein
MRKYLVSLKLCLRLGQKWKVASLKLSQAYMSSGSLIDITMSMARKHDKRKQFLIEYDNVAIMGPKVGACFVRVNPLANVFPEVSRGTIELEHIKPVHDTLRTWVFSMPAQFSRTLLL